MDFVSIAQNNIRKRPLFASHQMDNLKAGLGCTGVDLLRALEGMATAQPNGIPVAADDAPELFDIQEVEIAPEQHTTYPVLSVLADGVPDNLLQRSGASHRRPAVKLFNSRTKGLIFGFYREIPVLMKEDDGKLHSFPGVMSDRVRLLNVVGGLDIDFEDLPHIERPAIFFVDFDWANFCHWISDWMIGLNWLCAGGGRKPRDFQYVFDRKPKAFHLESLKLLGVDESNISYPERERRQYLFRTDNVIATSLGSRSFRHAFYCGADWAMEFTRRNLLRSSKKKFPSRFVISRATRGAVFSEGARKLLARRGFTHVTLEKMPLADQLALFAQAKAIVAPHGAGLTSIAFCRPGTNVFEIFNKSLGTHAFFTIAAHAGLNYHCAACDAPPGTPDGEISEDAFVSEDILSAWLDKACV